MFKPPDSHSGLPVSLQGYSFLSDKIGQDAVGLQNLFRIVLIEWVADKGLPFVLWPLFQMKQWI